MAKYDIGQRVKYPCDVEGEITGITISQDRSVHYQIGTSTYDEDVLSPVEPAEESAPAPVKLYCVKSDPGWLTRGKVYTFDGHCVNYDEGGCFRADNFEDWKRGDSGLAECLYPLVSRPAKVGEYIIPISITGYAKHDHRYDIHDLLRVTKDDTNIIHQWIGKAVGFENLTHPERPWRFAVILNEDYLVLDGYDGRYEKKDEPTFTVTRAQIAALGACSSGLAWFDKRHADGKADFGKLVREAREDGRGGDAEWLRNREAKLNEEPKYYSGKVVCVETTSPSYFTIGKVYEFINGRVTADNGSNQWGIPKTTLEDAANETFQPTRFIEYKGEARHE